MPRYSTTQRHSSTRSLIVLTSILLFACMLTRATESSTLGELEGASIVASDGQFLGIITENS